MNKLYCIGDSHVSVFLGKDKIAKIFPFKNISKIKNIEVFHIGPILAYNLCEYNTQTRGRENLEHILMSYIPQDSTIIISAGEIDCRVHLIKQAQLQKKLYSEIAVKVAKRYVSYLNSLQKNYRICILFPPPTSFLSEDKIDFNYPRYGSESERNKMTFALRVAFQQECFNYKISFIDVFDELLTKDGKVIKKMLWDGVHLSTNALPIIIRHMNQKLIIKMKLSTIWQIKELLRKIKHNYISLKRK